MDTEHDLWVLILTHWVHCDQEFSQDSIYYLIHGNSSEKGTTLMFWSPDIYTNIEPV